mmetsp:Transcript_8991/g.26448  ORF Transcript_8991/g.26448 Transcript_8991/m.26448 type:complete len:369 (-) Transcript_8991:35-1141(-)
MGQAHEAGTWGVLGLVLCAVGSLFTSLGLVLQKYSHIKLRGSSSSVAIYYQPWWVVGFSTYMGGQALNFVAMAWAPQAILSALATLSLVFIGILAWLIMGETTQPLELIAMPCVIAGVIMVLVAVPAQSGHPAEHTAAFVSGALARTGFLAIAACLAVCLALTWPVLSFCPWAKPVFWSVLTGVIAGYTSTLFKVVSMLLFIAHHPWAHWQIYVVGAVVGLLCLAQVHTLNLALSLGQTGAVVPITFALGVLIQIMNAQMAFQELMQMRKSTLFWVGVVLVIVAMVGIVRVQMSADEEQAREEEEADAEREKVPILKNKRSQTNSFPSTNTRRLGPRRRHSTYAGLRDASLAAGRMYPMATTGLLIVA